ncbi:MAG: pyridoxamine 5'-phosphate oxidase family protein [Betaproteobacteria bacterium]|nr:pyridoxamine 5'-phosphate oxidase family protein [Betaproteobacteria bacterium]
MSHAFARIAFTPAVKAAQTRDGSRNSYARAFERNDGTQNDRLGAAETEFIAAQRSLYMATVSETGWPYVQHRGGPVGFLKVLDANTLGFADFGGNRQLVSIGNLAGNDRVALILVDYGRRARLKILGRLSVREVTLDDPQLDALVEDSHRGHVQRVMKISVEAFDWNCSKHIPERFEAEDVRRAIEERDTVIEQLKARIKQLEHPPAVSE